jgi:hypothetical protein
MSRKHQYGRLRTNEEVQRKISQAVSLGHPGTRVVKSTETVEILIDDETAMRAVRKDDNTWVCIYNPKYYPKP